MTTCVPTPSDPHRRSDDDPLVEDETRLVPHSEPPSADARNSLSRQFLMTRASMQSTRASTKGRNLLRTGTKDFKIGFYKSTDRARADKMVQDQPTRPFVDALLKVLFDILCFKIKSLAFTQMVKI